MLLSKKTVEENATLALWEINETIDELLDLLHLDPFIIQEISLFTSDKRKLEYLAARVLLQEVIGEKKTIAYTKQGKPYLVDNSFQISITHTGKQVAILLHPTYRVGVDVEKISDKVVRVQSKFLSEYRFLEKHYFHKSNSLFCIKIIFCFYCVISIIFIKIIGIINIRYRYKLLFHSLNGIYGIFILLLYIPI